MAAGPAEGSNVPGDPHAVKALLCTGLEQRGRAWAWFEVLSQASGCRSHTSPVLLGLAEQRRPRAAGESGVAAGLPGWGAAVSERACVFTEGSSGRFVPCGTRSVHHQHVLVVPGSCVGTPEAVPSARQLRAWVWLRRGAGQICEG